MRFELGRFYQEKGKTSLLFKGNALRKNSPNKLILINYMVTEALVKPGEC